PRHAALPVSPSLTRPATPRLAMRAHRMSPQKPASLTPLASTTAMQPSGMCSMAARVDLGELQDSGVARSSRAGMNRTVNARPTLRGRPGASGNAPRIHTLRRPFFSRMVVRVAVVTPASAWKADASCGVVMGGLRFRIGTRRCRRGAHVRKIYTTGQAPAASLALHGGHYGARAAMVAMLAQVNALPCAETKPAIADGNAQAGPEQAGLQVRGQVVAAFISVPVIRFVFGHRVVEITLEIGPHGGIGVFVDRERRRSVLDEQVQQAHLEAPQLGQPGQDFVCHQMEAAPARG